LTSRDTRYFSPNLNKYVTGIRYLQNRAEGEKESKYLSLCASSKEADSRGLTSARTA
jgi:hypothetical protein